jgi:hypothetical protein
MVRRCVSTFMTWRSFGDNSTPPLLFYLLHLKRHDGLAKLKSGPQSFNYIEFDLFIFNFIHWHLIFYVFLSNLILILLIHIYFAFNLFSDWILFFNLIPNHLVLVFFLIWSPFLWLKLLLFWYIFLINGLVAISYIIV